MKEIGGFLLFVGGLLFLLTKGIPENIGAGIVLLGIILVVIDVIGNVK